MMNLRFPYQNSLFGRWVFSQSSLCVGWNALTFLRERTAVLRSVTQSLGIWLHIRIYLVQNRIQRRAVVNTVMSWRGDSLKGGQCIE